MITLPIVLLVIWTACLLAGGYVGGRIHAWFLELIWRDLAGKRLRAIAGCGNAAETQRAITNVLEMSEDVE